MYFEGIMEVDMGPSSLVAVQGGRMPFLLFSPLHHCGEGRALGVDVHMSNWAVG